MAALWIHPMKVYRQSRPQRHVYAPTIERAAWHARQTFPACARTMQGPHTFAKCPIRGRLRHSLAVPVPSPRRLVNPVTRVVHCSVQRERQSFLAPPSSWHRASAIFATWLFSEQAAVAATDFSKGSYRIESYWASLGLFLISVPGELTLSFLCYVMGAAVVRLPLQTVLVQGSGRR